MPEAPLVVAANRDELLARPAVPMTVLRDAAPRILGGRDQTAGGTWMAVNEHGVVAGLTNVPFAGAGPARRSRGLLPMFLAEHRDAASAVAALVVRHRIAEFNPAWILAGDRDTLWYVDGSGTTAPTPRRLDRGVHVLENVSLDTPSPKAEAVRAAIAEVVTRPLVEWTAGLFAVLGDHRVAGSSPGRPPETLANCVHAGPYGTRSAMVVRVGEGLPDIEYTEGPPCMTLPIQARW